MMSSSSSSSNSGSSSSSGSDSSSSSSSYSSDSEQETETHPPPPALHPRGDEDRQHEEDDSDFHMDDKPATPEPNFSLDEDLDEDLPSPFLRKETELKQEIKREEVCPIPIKQENCDVDANSDVDCDSDVEPPPFSPIGDSPKSPKSNIEETCAEEDMEISEGGELTAPTDIKQTEEENDLFTEVELTAPATPTPISIEKEEEQQFEPPCPVLIKIEKHSRVKERNRRESRADNPKNDDILYVDLDGFIHEEDIFRYMKKSFPSDDVISKIPRVGRILQVRIPFPSKFKKTTNRLRPSSVSSSSSKSSFSSYSSESESLVDSEDSYHLSDDEGKKSKNRQSSSIKRKRSPSPVTSSVSKKKKGPEPKPKPKVVLSPKKKSSSSSSSTSSVLRNKSSNFNSSSKRRSSNSSRSYDGEKSSTKDKSRERSRDDSKSKSSSSSRSKDYHRDRDQKDKDRDRQKYSSSSKKESSSYRKKEESHSSSGSRSSSSKRRESTSSSSSRRSSTSSTLDRGDSYVGRSVRDVVENLLNEVEMMVDGKCSKPKESTSSSHSKSRNHEMEKDKYKSSNKSSSRAASGKERARSSSTSKLPSSTKSREKSVFESGRNFNHHKVKVKTEPTSPNQKQSSSKREENKKHEVRKPLIMRPKKEVVEEENKFRPLPLKRVIGMEKLAMKSKQTHHAIKNEYEKEETSEVGCVDDGVSIKFQSFKIPKKKDPEKAKLVKFTPILKQSPGAFVPNEEASDELRGETQRKVRFTVPEGHREEHSKKKRKEVERDRPRKIVLDPSLVKKELKDKDKKKIQDADLLFFPDTLTNNDSNSEETCDNNPPQADASVVEVEESLTLAIGGDEEQPPMQEPESDQLPEVSPSTQSVAQIEEEWEQHQAHQELTPSFGLVMDPPPELSMELNNSPSPYVSPLPLPPNNSQYIDRHDRDSDRDRTRVSHSRHHHHHHNRSRGESSNSNTPISNSSRHLNRDKEPIIRIKRDRDSTDAPPPPLSRLPPLSHRHHHQDSPYPNRRYEGSSRGSNAGYPQSVNHPSNSNQESPSSQQMYVPLVPPLSPSLRTKAAVKDFGMVLNGQGRDDDQHRREFDHF